MAEFEVGCSIRLTIGNALLKRAVLPFDNVVIVGGASFAILKLIVLIVHH